MMRTTTRVTLRCHRTPRVQDRHRTPRVQDRHSSTRVKIALPPAVPCRHHTEGVLCPQSCAIAVERAPSPPRSRAGSARSAPRAGGRSARSSCSRGAARSTGCSARPAGFVRAPRRAAQHIYVRQLPRSREATQSTGSPVLRAATARRMYATVLTAAKRPRRPAGWAGLRATARRMYRISIVYIRAAARRICRILCQEAQSWARRAAIVSYVRTVDDATVPRDDREPQS